MRGHRSASPKQLRLVRMASDETAIIFETFERGLDPNDAAAVYQLREHARLLALAADALGDELRPRQLRVVRGAWS
jgi:hypothetical protein